MDINAALWYTSPMDYFEDTFHELWRVPLTKGDQDLYLRKIDPWELGIMYQHDVMKTRIVDIAKAVGRSSAYVRYAYDRGHRRLFALRIGREVVDVSKGELEMYRSHLDTIERSMHKAEEALAASCILKRELDKALKDIPPTLPQASI